MLTSPPFRELCPFPPLRGKVFKNSLDRPETSSPCLRASVVGFSVSHSIQMLDRKLHRPGVVGLAARAVHDVRCHDEAPRNLVVGEVRRAMRAQVLEAQGGGAGL